MIIRDIELLSAAIKDKAKKAIADMNADSKLKQLGASGVVIIETIRQLVTQMAYYARGRMDVDDVRSMFYAAKLWELSDMEANGTVSRAEANSRRLTAINARFAELDQARARPLAAYALGRQTPADTARLTEIEDEAARLRARLAELRAEEIKP